MKERVQGLPGPIAQVQQSTILVPAGLPVDGQPSDDPTLREDEDPLDPGDLDLVLAPQVGGGEGGEKEEE